MSKEKKLIPELRFPEFKNEGEWIKKELNELGELINGLTYSPDDIRNKGLLVLRSSNIQNGRIELNDCVYVREDIKGANLTVSNDILVCVRNGSKNLIGKNAIIPKDLPLATHGAFMTVFRAINPEFAFQLFQTDYYDNQVKADLGATINSINGKNFLKYEFPVPKNPKEQQKIASCLSSLDEVIESENQKLDLLKDHKKGLMQNLFPQEGEKVPKYRFPEFENDGEWVEKTLGEIGESLMCKRIFKEQTTTNPNNGIPFYKIGTFGKQADAYISIDLYEEFKSKYSFPKAGDILISASGTIGRIVVFDGSPAYFQDSNIVWLGNDEKLVLNEFLYHCYSIVKWQTSDGGVISRLYNSDLKNIAVKFPKNQKEQQKIASCLSSLDAIITAQAEKIEQLKLHKKGLMQGLFPKMSNVKTGHALS